MLISHSSLLLFVTGAAVLLVIPGPAVTYVVSRSIGHGRAAGLVSVMGIVVGTLFHVVAATLGLSALLASASPGFQFLKYLGAAYLLFSFELASPSCPTEYLRQRPHRPRLSLRLFRYQNQVK